jgi:hypothetical protein
MNLRWAYMITLESSGMSHSKKIVYCTSRIPIPRNERKQTGPYTNPLQPLQFNIRQKTSKSLTGIAPLLSNEAIMDWEPG